MMSLFHFKKLRLQIFFVFILFFGLCFSVSSYAVIALPSYNVRLDQTTISGFSSGAFMAVQMGVAHSSIIKGLAAVAGGPYYCAKANVQIGFTRCLIGSPDVNELIAVTDEWGALNLIDMTENMTQQKIWLFHGYNDGRVKASVSNSLFNYYKNYTVEDNIFYKNNLPAGHGWITDRIGKSCDNSEPPYINNCDYDSAGQLLQHFYGTLSPAQVGELSGEFIEFNQSDFNFTDDDINAISMANTGYAYIPSSCAALQPCRVHIVFHGCKQYAERVGNQFYINSGLNEWADTNNIIVLYPQTTGSTNFPQNPDGCWDSWGYTGNLYTQNNSGQVSYIRSVLTRISANYTGWNTSVNGSFSAPQNLSASDSTHTQIELHWQAVSEASGYNIYQADCGSCQYYKMTPTPISGLSFVDHNLDPETRYYYRIKAVKFNGDFSDFSNSVSQITASSPNYCDPYRRDNVTHTFEGRAFAWFGSTYLYNFQYIGSWNTEVFTNLRQIAPFIYIQGTCQ